MMKTSSHAHWSSRGNPNTPVFYLYTPVGTLVLYVYLCAKYMFFPTVSSKWACLNWNRCLFPQNQRFLQLLLILTTDPLPHYFCCRRSSSNLCHLILWQIQWSTHWNTCSYSSWIRTLVYWWIDFYTYHWHMHLTYILLCSNIFSDAVIFCLWKGKFNT